MAMAKKQPIAQDAYNELAEAYAASVDTKPHNAYYERPATLSLLPDVNGKHVLDAGCGPGVYSEWLVAHGGIVVAIDANEKMVTLARQRLGETVQLVQANLEVPLDFLADDSFDIVVCPLVMDYIKEWEPTFKEFHRILRAQGCLVFSMEHPYMKYATHHLMSNYFKVERVEYVWRGFGKPVSVPSYRRPLSEVVNPLLKVGFILDQILEPLPIEEFYEKDPEDYDELMRSPGFMCVKATKA
jgi:ubiquinone/menaquinone biosynthesis C-methylase UbiE